ncbi:hypothetical protein RIR_jg22673.t1 [Rhizophagus irregularis DAOM 181602=DAOM 197198]|nr:hypothetical protein RIR_jg22673.t1 [Rhizophagus irregularis DAOM 181602=DAOM 197198]
MSPQGRNVIETFDFKSVVRRFNVTTNISSGIVMKPFLRPSEAHRGAINVPVPARTMVELQSHDHSIYVVY